MEAGYLQINEEIKGCSLTIQLVLIESNHGQFDLGCVLETWWSTKINLFGHPTDHFRTLNIAVGNIFPSFLQKTDNAKSTVQSTIRAAVKELGVI